MLHQHTLDQLRGLRLDGMIAALADTATQAAAEALPFEQRLALLVQRELDWRDGKRVARLLKAARLKVSSACIEDIDWRAGRGLDRHLVTALAEGDWVMLGDQPGPGQRARAVAATLPAAGSSGGMGAAGAAMTQAMGR